MDAFLSTIEETIPQVLKASSLSTLSSSPCSPGGCTLSSVQLSFLPRGENDPSSPYSLSLSLYYQPWSDLNRSQKISFNHCWRGAVGRARTKSSGEAREGDEDPTCSLSPPLRSGILFPRHDPTSRAWLVRLSNLLLSNVSRNVFINGIGFRLAPPPLLLFILFLLF